eukprot:m.109108 g.109108  ORF g.109108 m.109108 type:complete len:1314 (+) comp13363_c0_seq2:173-4114(+)
MSRRLTRQPHVQSSDEGDMDNRANDDEDETDLRRSSRRRSTRLAAHHSTDPHSDDGDELVRSPVELEAGDESGEGHARENDSTSGSGSGSGSGDEMNDSEDHDQEEEDGVKVGHDQKDGEGHPADGGFVRRSTRTRHLLFPTFKETELVSLSMQEQKRRQEQEERHTRELAKQRNQRLSRRAQGQEEDGEAQSGSESGSGSGSGSGEDESGSEEESEGEEMVEIAPSRPGLRTRFIPRSKLQPHHQPLHPLEPSDDEEEEQDSDATETARKRPKRARKPVQRYNPALEDKSPKRITRQASLVSGSSTRQRSDRRSSRKSRSRDTRRRKYRDFRQGSTTEDNWSSGDESFFAKRKARSMAHARQQLLPVNYHSISKDERRVLQARAGQGGVGASGADVEPMTIDKTTNFDNLGGLDHHIRALKEMIVFPFLYPEVFDRFKMDPPRGVLFHGPPGTGKTLCARALANECSRAGRKVSFFMRKGADCLSKWIGESERMLRLLFDQAYTCRPSVIFFDEIDGLAPVRTSRQDQNYSSIVSTLLALMDGLDSRGDVIVIGATNRIDNIDPALRRPGRFDREFRFPLPSLTARQSILKIHTQQWRPQLSDEFLSALAEECAGYCGADLKALCTEAGLLALRRTYPQIYDSDVKLKLNMRAINVTAVDFKDAMAAITPAAQRSVIPPGRRLDTTFETLFAESLALALEKVNALVPRMFSRRHRTLLVDDQQESPETGPSILSKDVDPDHSIPAFHGFFHAADGAPWRIPDPAWPRLLLVGEEGAGHMTHIAPAILRELEKYPIYTLDLPSLFASTSVRSVEEAAVQTFREARTHTPSVLYLPRLADTFTQLPTVRVILTGLLQDLPRTTEMLVLATANHGTLQAAFGVDGLFPRSENKFLMPATSDEQLRKLFMQIVIAAKTPPPTQENLSRQARARLRAATRELDVASSAPSIRTLNQAEKAHAMVREEATLRELRMYMRNVLMRIMSERKFKHFLNDDEFRDVPDYLDIIKCPMTMEGMLEKLNQNVYLTIEDVVEDVDLIVSNALLYNPQHDSTSLIVRRRAQELRDEFLHFFDKAKLEFPRLIQDCRDIASRRKGESQAQQATGEEDMATGSMHDGDESNDAGSGSGGASNVFDALKDGVDEVEDGGEAQNTTTGANPSVPSDAGELDQSAAKLPTTKGDEADSGGEGNDREDGEAAEVSAGQTAPLDAPNTDGMDVTEDTASTAQMPEEQGQVQGVVQEAAAATPEEHEAAKIDELTLSHEDLDAWVDKAVQASSNISTLDLEQLYCDLWRIVHSYSRTLDRRNLVQEMEAAIKL